MTQSLYKLARAKKLPKHQFMDEDTLNWITKNIPNELGNIDYSLIKKQFAQKLLNLTKYLPEIEWYQNKLVINGIHGSLHSYRVATYTLILNELLHINLNNDLLCVAGLCHDIKRNDDKDDISHGQRSAFWVKNNKGLIEKHLNKKFADNDFSFIILAIFFHDINCESSNKKILTQKQQSYLNVLKTADAIDRYRLPKIKWWINDSYLELKPTAKIKAFAFDLIFITEINKLKSLTLKQSIQCFLQT